MFPPSPFNNQKVKKEPKSTNPTKPTQKWIIESPVQTMALPQPQTMALPPQAQKGTLARRTGGGTGTGPTDQNYINQQWMDYWNSKGPRPEAGTVWTGYPIKVPIPQTRPPYPPIPPGTTGALLQNYINHQWMNYWNGHGGRPQEGTIFTHTLFPLPVNEHVLTQTPELPTIGKVQQSK